MRFHFAFYWRPNTKPKCVHRTYPMLLSTFSCHKKMWRQQWTGLGLYRSPQRYTHRLFTHAPRTSKMSPGDGVDNLPQPNQTESMPMSVRLLNTKSQALCVDGPVKNVHAHRNGSALVFRPPTNALSLTIDEMCVASASSLWCVNSTFRFSFARIEHCSLVRSVRMDKEMSDLLSATD